MTLPAPTIDRSRHRGAATFDPLGWARRLAAWIEGQAEWDRERWILWLPVAMGLGIAGYFALPFEPPIWPAPVAIAGLVLIAVWGQRRALGLVVVYGVLALAAGFAVAQLRTTWVAAPVLDKRLGPVTVLGQVLEIEPQHAGRRVVLHKLEIDRLDPQEVPARVRVRLTSKDMIALSPGDRVRLRAVLQPPPEPAAPGAYDFARQAYFQGLGGVGFAVSRADLLTGGPDRPGAGLVDRWRLWWAAIRSHIAERVLAAVPGETGAVASALMTGQRGAIPDRVMDNMRHSGLAHLLAISGLHMGLVAGLIFFGVRAGLALVPALALRYPIKKWAAVTALLGAFAYLFMVGATIPTQRAFLMVSLVLLAVLLDRRALSLRLVAWAALVVLLLAPESLLSAGFQMSFAAVTALVASYEVMTKLPLRAAPDDHAARRVGFYLIGVVLTSVIAIAATAPFAAYHFNRLAAYGLAANLFAVPATAFWIMPWALVAYLLMPLGLEGPALQVMAWGVQAVLSVAELFGNLEGAVLRVGTLPLVSFALFVAGGLWLCLWRSPWRLAGLGMFGVGLLLAGTADPPDLLVSDDGKLVAIRGESGALWFSSLRSGSFTRDVWLRRDGAALAEAWPKTGKALESRLSCDPLGCLYREQGQIVALVRDPRALAEDCRMASVLISPEPLRRLRCPAPDLVIDRFDLWRQGAHALWLAPGAVTLKTVAESRGQRPWVRRRGR